MKKKRTGTDSEKKIREKKLNVRKKKEGKKTVRGKDTDKRNEEKRMVIKKVG